MPSKLQAAAGRRGGFSIVELLCVVTIMSMVTAITMSSLGGGAWRSVESGANALGGHLDLARQHAVLNGCLTALVVATQGDEAGRSFTILKKTATGWTLLGRWQTLPPGVVFDADSQAGFFDLPDSTYTSLELPALSQKGAQLEPGIGYCARLFYPNGQLLGNNAAKLRVSWQADQQTDSGSDHSINVVLIPSSGRIKYTSR